MTFFEAYDNIKLTEEMYCNTEKVLELQLEKSLIYYPIIHHYVYSNIYLLNYCASEDKRYLPCYKPMVLSKNTKYIKEFSEELRRIKSIHGLERQKSEEVITLVQDTSKLIGKMYKLEHPVKFTIDTILVALKITSLNLLKNMQLISFDNILLLQKNYDMSKNKMLITQ